MVNLSNYNPNNVSNPNNNIFGLPTNEEDARLIIVPIPWEVTVSYGAGTARAPEAIFKASMFCSPSLKFTGLSTCRIRNVPIPWRSMLKSSL